MHAPLSSRSNRVGLLRGRGRRAVDGCMGADNSPAWGANHDANKGANSAVGPSEETGLRAGGGANGRSDGCADHKADHSMAAALGAGRCRNADNVFTFY